MHILHVTLAFPPAYAWGGPVKIVHQNARELVRRGHRVTVYCTNLLNKRQKIEPRTFERELDGIRVVYLNAWHLPWWPGTLGPVWLPELAGYLEREARDFDVVHLNGYRSPMLWQAARSARRAGLPIVTQPHGMMPVIVNSFWAKRLYDAVLGGAELRGLGALVAGQESERQQALARGVPGERVVIIPNGIDPGERERVPEPGSFRRRFGLAHDRPLVLFLGRINKKKGTDLLVEAFARLKGLDAQLAIVGPDDGQLAEVRSLVRRHRLEERVILPGLVQGDEALAALQDADLFVLPCRTDTFPFAIVEACLVGTPMVISDRCEMAHLVRDRVADVVPLDIEALAAAMARLLADRERAARYRANSQAVLADTFSIAAVVDRLEALYRRVMAERS